MISRISGTVKVAPVLPAKNITLSNCDKGRILPYGPSIATLVPLAMFTSTFDEGSAVECRFAWVRKRLVPPFLD